MDVKNVNPFVEAFSLIMPMLGFTDIKKGALGVKPQEITCSGVIIIVGIVGAVKGNIVYNLETSDAMKIASTMMMGIPVPELDDMSKSALSELTNMLAANASTIFSNSGVLIDISTPTMLCGNNVTVNMGMKQVLCVQLIADGLPLDLNIAIE